MRLGHHMINFKWQVIKALWHLAVFADRCSPVPNQLFQIAVHD